jgi:hypothetical protein
MVVSWALAQSLVFSQSSINISLDKWIAVDTNTFLFLFSIF